MRYPADHKRETRERVLAEAAERIRAHGPLGIGVAEVTKRAGLTPGGLYAHFTSKDSLIAAGNAKMFEGARVRWQGATETRDAKSGLAAYIQSYLSPKHRDARGKCCPIAALSSELPRHAQRVPPRVRRGYPESDRADRARAPRGRSSRRGCSGELGDRRARRRAVHDETRSDALLAVSRRALCARLGLVSH